MALGVVGDLVVKARGGRHVGVLLEASLLGRTNLLLSILVAGATLCQHGTKQLSQAGTSPSFMDDISDKGLGGHSSQ